MIRRSAWDAVGGFDERQWMSAEDLDLGWRLRDAGWATRYEPRAIVDHEGSAATAKLFGGENLMPHWQRATYGCIARRRGLRRAQAVAMINLAGTLARAAAAAPLDRERARGLLEWATVHVQALGAGSALDQFGAMPAAAAMPSTE
jgi:GT2 family glycosyltransferase